MSRRDKYTPDYSKLYSGVHIAPEVMRVLTGSDRKMKYCEYDLKTERVRKNTRTKATMVYPAREDSLDRLSEENNRHYALEVASPEDLVAAQDEIIRLKQALWKLKPDEWELYNGPLVKTTNRKKFVNHSTLVVCGDFAVGGRA
jgi:hypothetical protein